MSFDEHLRQFFSKPRTLQAQLYEPAAKEIQDVCAIVIPALAKCLSAGCQKLISHMAGNTLVGVPLWAVATEPKFFKEARPHLRKHMWTKMFGSDSYGSGRTDLYTLDLKELSLAMWRHVIANRVRVCHDPPRNFRNFNSRRGRCTSWITDVNYNGTAVKKSDGNWMQIMGADAKPRFEYRLCIEPNYDRTFL